MNCYNSSWYLNAVAPGWARCHGFPYVLNDRGEAASPYGYPGTGGADLAEVRKLLNRPLFIRHHLDSHPVGTGHPTRVIPVYQPWTEEAEKEVKRAAAAGVVCWQGSKSGDTLARFAKNYREAMAAKNAAPKYKVLADRITQWANNDQVLVLETKGAGALFLIDSDSWAHYHLSHRSEMAHNLSMASIFALAVPMLKERGVTRIHMGGGMSKDPKDSLYTFKSFWGRQPYHIYQQEIK